MKFKVYEKSCYANPVYFTLDEEDDGGIMLSALDGEGMLISNVLKIQPDGTLFRSAFVSEKTGLRFDEEGRVMLLEK